MMKIMTQEIKHNSSMYKAEFVAYDEDVETFKYKKLHKFKHILENIKLNIKRKINSLIQKQKLWIDEIDWGAVRRDGTLWMVEAGIEGLIINFVTYFLLAADFNLFTVFAYGFAVKETLSIYWRMRNNGAIAELPKREHGDNS